MRRLWLVLALAGCGSSPYFGTTTPRHGPDELWINNASEPEWIDPGKCSDQVGGEIISNVFAGLMQPNPMDLTPLPDIAASYERLGDGRRYVFHLRKTTWSDGTPFTARDFEWSWKRVLNPKTASHYNEFFYVLQGGAAFNQGALWVTGGTSPEAVQAAVAKVVPVQRVEAALEPAGVFVFLDGPESGRAALRSRATLALDGQQGLHVTVADASLVGLHAEGDDTLIVRLNEPVPYFLDMLSFHTAMPAPRHVIERLVREGKNPDLWTRPENIVTNGAYVLREWKFRQYLVLEKNPRYWDAAHVATARVTLREVESSNTALNLYRAGELDWIGATTALPSELVSSLRGYRDYVSAPFLTVYWYWLNPKKPPLDDVRVRKALSLAIDRATLARAITRRGETPTADVVPDGLAGYRGLGSPIFDPERARALLAEAGHPGGKGLPEIVLNYNTSEGHRLIAEAVQAMWKQHLGIDVRLQNLEWKVMLDDLTRHDYQICRLGWIGDYPDPTTFLEVFKSESGNNHAGWKDPEFDRLFERANQNADRGTRLELLRQAEARLADAQIVLPLYVYTRSQVVKPYVRGFWANYQDRHPYKWMAIDERGGAARDTTPFDPRAVGLAPAEAAP